MIIFRSHITITDSRGACPALPSPRAVRSCSPASPSLWEGREASASEHSRGGLSPQQNVHPHSPLSSLRPPASGLQSRRAFTLTELLVVITIIGMLAGISLGALYSARQSARVQRTKATIAKLDRIVQERYGEFALRRMPFPANVRSLPSKLPLPRADRPAFFAEARLRAIHQLQKWEMPDRLEDVANPMDESDPFDPADMDTPWTYSVSNAAGETWTVSMTRTAVARSMFRRQAAQISTPQGGAATKAEANADIAEVFYMWVVTGDREVVEQFQPHEIGDTDQDGYPEFLDAWGEPIRFIRTPTSFVSESNLMTGDPVNDHDPFDTRGINKDAFRTIPLVYSKGPDKRSGLEIELSATSFDDVYDPEKKFGKPVDDSKHDEYECHHDNIHNHSLGMN